MMKKNLKLVIGIAIAIIIISIATSVLAADSTNTIILPGTITTTQNETSNVVANVTTNVTASVTTNNTTNTTLPKTGVTDGYVVAILVTVCAISAIYAYRKIRDYNIK